MCKKRILQNVMVELTDYCNLSCPMCDQSGHGRGNETGIVHQKRKNFFPFSLFKKLISDLKDNFDYVENISLFWQGEPLLHPRFSDFILFLKSSLGKKIRGYTIHTNGLFWNESVDKLILKDKNKYSFIHFSMDAATEATYSSIRKGGDFKELLKNVIQFIEMKEEKKTIWPIVVLQFIVMEENYREALLFYHFWKTFLENNNIKNFSLVSDESFFYDSYLIYFRRCGGGPEKQQKLDSLFSKVWRKIEKYQKKLYKKEFYFDSKYNFQIERGCISSFFNPVISATGDVTICCLDMKLDFCLGNIKNNKLSSLWYSPRANLIRKILQERAWNSDFWLGNQMLKMCSQCPNLKI